MVPRRIVSLCPSITETLVAIGGYKRLVAATRYCVRPKGMLWGLPRIGGTKNPDTSRILALKPDLVFANEEEVRRTWKGAFRIMAWTYPAFRLRPSRRRIASVESPKPRL